MISVICTPKKERNCRFLYFYQVGVHLIHIHGKSENKTNTESLITKAVQLAGSVIFFMSNLMTKKLGKFKKIIVLIYHYRKSFQLQIVVVVVFNTDSIDK